MLRLSPLYLLAALALAAGPAAAQEQDAPSGRKVWVIQPATGVQAPAATPGVTAPQPPAAPAPATPAPAAAPASTAQVEAGLLECRGEMATAYGLGSSRKVTCEYRPVSGQNQYYSGTLNRAGLDFGVSDQASMLWMVLATTPRLGPGALAGEYVGFTSGAAVGPGFSANVLVAKDSTAGIALQPLSVSSDSGLSISLAAASLTLEPTTAPKR
ncbi:DUF992 domain-containing protein [Azorhizobium doebereinerae]|uniref:DUF992 domain-containing protein n=1 Tax=Azorhizobium doebereinerae TaxID=281091 RepID=UPI00040939A3|nr:DUF992 domain-containing protein [Azorhizobium doebereinerae]